jgi:serine/threonine protein kinase
MDDLFNQISEAHYDWPDAPVVSPAVKDFIKKLLVLAPGERLTAEQALKHPWLS